MGDALHLGEVEVDYTNDEVSEETGVLTVAREGEVHLLAGVDPLAELVVMLFGEHLY